MGLLGNVSQEEMEQAMKPPAPLPEADYFFTIDEVKPTANGRNSGQPYIPLELAVIGEDGSTRRVYHNVSLSPKARPMILRFLQAISLDPNAFEDPSQLKGLSGKAHFKVGKTDKGNDRGEVGYFIVAN